MTIYNVTKTFDKGFVNALKVYLNSNKLDIRYSDWLNDINIFTYNKSTTVMENKKGYVWNVLSNTYNNSRMIRILQLAQW